MIVSVCVVGCLFLGLFVCVFLFKCVGRFVRFIVCCLRVSLIVCLLWHVF